MLTLFAGAMNAAKAKGDAGRVMELEREKGRVLHMSQKFKAAVTTFQRSQLQNQGGAAGGLNVGGGGMGGNMNMSGLEGTGMGSSSSKDNNANVNKSPFPLPSQPTPHSQIQMSAVPNQNQSPNQPNFQSNQTVPSHLQQHQMQGLQHLGGVWQGTLSWTGFDAATQGRKEVHAQVAALPHGGGAM
jgi:hypothetical protein